MLTAYRRHLLACEHRAKGQHFSLCDCPVWCYGRRSDGKRIRESLRTNNWERAIGKIRIRESGGDAEDSPAAPSLGTATEAFLADCSARSLTKSTLDLYRYLFAHLRTFCGPRRTDPTRHAAKRDWFPPCVFPLVPGAQPLHH